MARRSKNRTAKPRRRTPKKEREGERAASRQEPEPRPSSLPEDEVAEASMDSFPASDAPSWSRREPDTRAEEREA